MSSIEIILVDGPARVEGGAFVTDAFAWPPPQTLRVVTGGPKGPELLDLPGDEVRPGERLHVYRRASGGTYKAGRSCGFFATYRIVRSAPVPQPSLFEAGLRSVT